MQIGESVAMVVDMMADEKCVICSEKHPEPKKDDVQAVAPGNSGWQRKSMSKVFKSDGKREKIYPSGFPPPYKHQGHHCVALSALVANANTSSPTDRRLRLNYYLDQVGFFPNRPENCIGLPARTSWGDFEAFFESIDLQHPLQLHGPGHDETYFTQCDRLLASLLSALTNPALCEQKPKDGWKDLLKTRMEQAENFAFNKLASNAGAWRLHAAEQITGLQLYFLPEAQTMSVKGVGGVSESRSGKGRKRAEVTFPDPGLDAGPF